MYVDLIIYRLTITFVQSARPILVICAERICSLLIYILVNLSHVHIWHPRSLCYQSDAAFLLHRPDRQLYIALPTIHSRT